MRPLFGRTSIQGSRETLPRPVYYVESDSNDNVLVAMLVEITVEGDGYWLVQWFDTVRFHAMVASEICIAPSAFWLKRADAPWDEHQEYSFKPMTLDIYYSKVKDRLIHGDDFDNEDDMIRAFLDTIGA